MYVITFYSFKGGVGRTMALVNVAAELVRLGRKVLVVDFDLEAPGLETYKELRRATPHAGIVEYVSQFRRTQHTPDIRDFIYETTPLGRKGGRLWVMPAGRRDRTYRSALFAIDWKRLYHDQGGFHLFEDTKKAWEQELGPDYVLIDSRTGETDVLGICTRQLPDSVAILFTPNEQNLAGLGNVCADIRREATKEGLEKRIRLHFVAANVPDLDDEHGILRRQLKRFRQQLEFQELSGVIRRYESMRLLDQSVVVLDQPKSRVARSYRRLARTLITDNPLDREGAIRFMRRYSQKFLPEIARDAHEEARSLLGIADETPATKSIRPFGHPLRFTSRPLNEIAHNFWEDAEVLDHVANCSVLEGDYLRASKLFERVHQLAPDRASTRYYAAVCHSKLGNKNGAAVDLLAYLRSPSLSRHEISRALSELHAIAPAQLAAVDLDDLALLDVFYITWADPDMHRWCVELLRERIARDTDGCSEPRAMIFELCGRLIAERRWDSAVRLLEAKPLEELGPVEDVYWTYYLAIANWGKSGAFPEHLFRFALERLEAFQKTDIPMDGDEPFDPLEVKCWGLWAAGRKAEALQVLDRMLVEAPELGSSPWRWQAVSANEYREDLLKMRRMFEGEHLRPAFLG